MNTPAFCPCCSSKLIRHIDGHRDYWFCRTCWSQMPILNKKERDPQKNYHHQSTKKQTINHHQNILNL